MKRTIAIRGAGVATGGVARTRGVPYRLSTDDEARSLKRRVAGSRSARLRIHPVERVRSREARGTWKRRIDGREVDQLRSASRFEQIDWDDLIEDRAVQTSRYRWTERFEQELRGPFADYGPFTHDEAESSSPGRRFGRPRASTASNGRRTALRERRARQTPAESSPTIGTRRGGRRGSRTSTGTRSSTIASCNRADSTRAGSPAIPRICSRATMPRR